MTPRKPRKMPKNQRAYPKGKPRLVLLTDEEFAVLATMQEDIGAPRMFRSDDPNKFYANAMRKWRALRNPPETLVEQPK